jgi:hypothetical protein
MNNKKQGVTSNNDTPSTPKSQIKESSLKSSPNQRSPNKNNNSSPNSKSGKKSSPLKDGSAPTVSIRWDSKVIEVQYLESLLVCIFEYCVTYLYTD